MLTINKQPNADTRLVTERVLEALEEIKPSLPKDVQILPNLYEQKVFIDLAIENVTEALRDGGFGIVCVIGLSGTRVTVAPWCNTSSDAPWSKV